MVGGRTITKRKISAVGWHTMPDGSIVGLIRVEITQTDDENQQLGTKYYIGAVAEPGEPYEDAKKIIDTGREFPQEWLNELIPRKTEVYKERGEQKWKN